MSGRPSGAQMPRWLVYGIVGKGIAIVAITIAVLYYAGVF